MRIALLYGPTGAGFPPLGALTLASLAKRMGLEVRVLPLPAAHQRATCARSLAAFDLVGFSTDCGTYPEAILLAQVLRQWAPRVPVVFGGPQATATAEATVRAFPAIDTVVRGEAEQSFARLLRRLEAGRGDWREVAGGVWMEGGALRSVEESRELADVDDVPLPDYAAFPTLGASRSIPLEVGRGCPYACTFCSTNTFFKRRFRMKSTGRIVADVRALLSAFRPANIDFIHDMFTVRRDLVLEIASAIGRLPVSWNCSARTDRLDAELMHAMAASGCAGVYVGLETGSRRLQRVLKKKLELGEAMATVRACQQLGMGVTASLIVGYPNETRDDLRDTLLCAMELLRPHPSPSATGTVDLQIPFFAPMPGTPILAEAGGLAFDGIVPSVIEVGEAHRLAADVEDLVRAHPGIFVAHHHPVQTEIPRAHYVVLMQVLTELTARPAVLRALAQREGDALVDFLLAPRLGALRGATQAATTAAVLRAFDARPRARLQRGLPRAVPA